MGSEGESKVKVFNKEERPSRLLWVQLLCIMEVGEVLMVGPDHKLDWVVQPMSPLLQCNDNSEELMCIRLYINWRQNSAEECTGKFSVPSCLPLMSEA